MGALTGDSKCFDEIGRSNIKLFTGRMFNHNNNHLYMHGWVQDVDHTRSSIGPVPMAGAMITKVEILDVLPPCFRAGAE